MTEQQPMSENVRIELEAIVGKRNLSTDRAIMSGYAWNSGIGKIPGDDKFLALWPIGVILPGSTEEVAAIVKACNRHDIHYKAMCTGYGSMGLPASEKTLIIELKRMNTLQIDADNRMALIGPYVSAGMLQAEALKHGMTCHIVGAGPSHSPLASATSFNGVGTTAQGTSINARNLLSWEWVTPEGEIVRGGSHGDDWFSGDGPGPGLRGLFRGAMGAAGALGVFTRIGYKLYPIGLNGRPVDTGAMPQLGMDIPENTGLIHAVWPSWEAHRDGTFALNGEPICFAQLRIPPNQLGWYLTSSNADYVAQAEAETLPEIARQENGCSWTLLTVSRSKEEHDWRMGCVKDAVESTGGRIVTLTLAEKELLFRGLFTSQYVPRVLRPSAGIATSFGVLDSFAFIPRAIEAAREMLGNDTNAGGPLVQSPSEQSWSWTTEGRHYWNENIVQFDPSSRESRAAAVLSAFRHFKAYWRKPVGILSFSVGPIMLVQKGLGEPYRYLVRIKQTLDPKNVSRTGRYLAPPAPPKLVKLLKIIRPITVLAPILRFVSNKISRIGL